MADRTGQLAPQYVDEAAVVASLWRQLIAPLLPRMRATRLVLNACETSVLPDHGDLPLALAGAFLCADACAVIARL